jgi:hypothetical protein
MPVRKVVTRRSNHFRGLVPSLKNGRSIPWESQLEGVFLRLLELSSQVLSYEVQPSWEFFEVSGETVKYTPDVCATFLDGSEKWFEIKPAARLLNKKVGMRMESASDHFSQTNRAFYIVTDELIKSEPLEANLALLMYHRRGPRLNAVEVEALHDNLASLKCRTIADACDALGEQRAWRYIGLGHIGLELQKPITQLSIIYLTEGHRHENFFA